MREVFKYFSFLILAIISFIHEFYGKEEWPKHDVSVILRLIEVYVTDKDGNPIDVLKKKIFWLKLMEKFIHSII